MGGSRSFFRAFEVYEYTIQKSGRWMPYYCGHPGPPTPNFGPQDMLSKGRTLARRCLLEKAWKDRKKVKIEIVGMDTDDKDVAYASSTAAPKLRAQRYGFSWNGFDERGNLFNCQDEECRWCARQEGSRWHGFGELYLGTREPELEKKYTTDEVSQSILQELQSCMMKPITVEVPFRDGFEKFFPNRAQDAEKDAEFPRLIDADELIKRLESISAVRPGSIRVLDTIVTVLYNYDHDHKVLKAFLDPNVEDVKFEHVLAWKSIFLIQKQNSMVLVSHIYCLHEEQSLTFE